MNFREFLRYLLLLVFAPNSLKTMEWRMLRYLNRDRKRNGLQPVRMQQDLRQVARHHSLDMAKKDYFDHINMKAQSPADRLKLSGVTDVTSGENLAKIGGYRNPTQHAEIGLMHSSGHRANILNPTFNCVGIGVILDSGKIYYFTQNFARRDLILKSSIPSWVKLKRGIHLKGDLFSDARAILFRVTRKKMAEHESQKVIIPRDFKFDLWLSFKETGQYEVELFVDLEGKGRFIMANSFEIKVRRGFFGLL